MYGSGSAVIAFAFSTPLSGIVGLLKHRSQSEGNYISVLAARRSAS